MRALKQSQPIVLLHLSLFIRPAQASDVVDLLDLQDHWREVFSRVGEGRVTTGLLVIGSEIAPHRQRMFVPFNFH